MEELPRSHAPGQVHILSVCDHTFIWTFSLTIASVQYRYRWVQHELKKCSQGNEDVGQRWRMIWYNSGILSPPPPRGRSWKKEYLSFFTCFPSGICVKVGRRKQTLSLLHCNFVRVDDWAMGVEMIKSKLDVLRIHSSGLCAHYSVSFSCALWDVCTVISSLQVRRLRIYGLVLCAMEDNP